MVLALKRPLRSKTSDVVQPTRIPAKAFREGLDFEYSWGLDCFPIVKCVENKDAHIIDGLFG